MVDTGSYSQVSFPFEWIKTEDGSMTLKPKSKDSEWMHSLKGAYSESQYIYGNALREIIPLWKSPLPIKIFSLGLGLGYVEWIAILECFRAKIDCCIHTYESESSLKEFFIEQVKKDSENFKYLQSFLLQDYSEAEFKNALQFLKSQFTNDNLKSLSEVKFFGSLNKDSILAEQNKFNLIFYDAYSSKSQNELWSYEFLNLFLEQLADIKSCALSSYACTATLKKTLKEKQFQIFKTKGFAYKRESTWAVRFRHS